MSANLNENLTQSIIQKLGKEGCEYVLKNGELPAVQLTNEEMEYIKGGFLSISNLKSLITVIKNVGRIMAQGFAFRKTRSRKP